MNIYEKYISNPNLPENKVTKVIIDYRTPKKIIENLSRVGVNTIFSCEVNSLYNVINGHCDLQIHHLADKYFTCTPNLLSYYKEKLPDCEIIQGTTNLSSNYPDDIAYNIARINKYAFHNLKYTDYSICKYYEKIGVKLVHVNQGYAKCNVCIVNENAIITSDMSIAKAADNYNFDVLLISQGDIKLADFPYGFIGGASGLIAPYKLAFTGDIRLHCDYNAIADFCFKYGVEPVSLSDEMLVDIGSVLPICELKDVEVCGKKSLSDETKLSMTL